MNISHAENILPLTPQSSAILLVLSSRPLYGYAIRQQVEKDLQIDVSVGSVYPTLNRMVQMMLIESAGVEKGTSSPNRRKLYTITKLGRDVLKIETERMSQFVGLARAYNKRP